MSNNLDIYGGLTDIKGEKTGYFHFEKIDGRYWFITPEGNGFFAVALSHTFSGEGDIVCDNIFDGDYDAWMEDSHQKSKELGYNCALGSATSPERNLNGFVDMDKAEAIFRKDNFPFTVGVILLKHPWEFVEGETLPDIYEDSYQELIETRAKEVCPKYSDDPLVMGYYYGYGAFNHSDGWVNHHMSRPAGSAGRNAIADILAKQYDNNVDAFNKVYGTELESIMDLKDKATIKFEEGMDSRNYASVINTLDQDKVRDFEAIISDMCIRLYKIAHDAIRKWDSNHLIFGSYIKEWVLSKDSWLEVSKYVDVMSPQHINKDISVDDLSEAVGMPMIISDDEAGWYYEGGIAGYRGLVSHDARAKTYETNLMRQYKDKLVMGVSYCGSVYDMGGDTLKSKQQNGYYDLYEGKPRQNLVDTVTKINKAVYKEAINPAKTRAELKTYDDAFFDTWEKSIAKKAKGESDSFKGTQDNNFQSTTSK